MKFSPSILGGKIKSPYFCFNTHIYPVTTFHWGYNHLIDFISFPLFLLQHPYLSWISWHGSYVFLRVSTLVVNLMVSNTVTRCWFKCEELSIDAGDPGRMLGVNSSYVFHIKISKMWIFRSGESFFSVHPRRFSEMLMLFFKILTDGTRWTLKLLLKKVPDPLNLD